LQLSNLLFFDADFFFIEKFHQSKVPSWLHWGLFPSQLRDPLPPPLCSSLLHSCVDEDRFQRAARFFCHTYLLFEGPPPQRKVVAGSSSPLRSVKEGPKSARRPSFLLPRVHPLLERYGAAGRTDPVLIDPAQSVTRDSFFPRQNASPPEVGDPPHESRRLLVGPDF